MGTVTVNHLFLANPASQTVEPSLRFNIPLTFDLEATRNPPDAAAGNPPARYPTVKFWTNRSFTSWDLGCSDTQKKKARVGGKLNLSLLEPRKDKMDRWWGSQVAYEEPPAMQWVPLR
ncbi:hypothetical protein Dda_8209 [Drechslerella dactyloides]|uniref:Uncharacterized protein n=1 Tax=Drechslerella dactyloides TaxID=74499 RepID=A0AAD6NGE1_DREDA|nr:hypothetical protein Dda_8209 [Drechslerella dactyloides]